MKMRLMHSLRISKKLHRRWLESYAIDVNLNAHWRRQLFNADPYEEFEINKNHTVGLPSESIPALTKYDLRFRAAKVNAEDAELWLSTNGCVIFKLWAEQFPTVTFFSGNNPNGA